MKLSDDPTGECRKIDQILPAKKAQKPQDRAREIESALDFGCTYLDSTEPLAPFPSLSLVVGMACRFIDFLTSRDGHNFW